MLIVSIIYGIVIVVGIAIIGRILFGIYVVTQGAFYAGSSDDRIKNILKLAKIRSTDKVIDLGSGDGKIVLAAAKTGATVTGIEIDPLYHWKAKKLIGNSKHRKNITIIRGSYWNHDLSDFDVIIIFGIGHIMKRLEQKILKEAKKDARIISVYFKFPNLKPTKVVDEVYLYKKPKV